MGEVNRTCIILIDKDVWPVKPKLVIGLWLFSQNNCLLLLYGVPVYDSICMPAWGIFYDPVGRIDHIESNGSIMYEELGLE
jgi:hypothetical protein